MTSDAAASASTMATTVTPPPPPPSSALSHETLRERILTGGGGIGNVRLSKVASLYADFLRLLQQQQQPPSLPSSTDTAAAAAAATTAAILTAHQALQTELQLHDLEMYKLLLASRACDGNSSRHDATLTQMESTLASTRSEIHQLSATLTKERQIKHNLEEYNALAKLGNSTSTTNNNNNNKQAHANPPICVTKSELNQVQQTIQNVESEIKEAQLEVMVREKQLRVLMASLGDLKCALLEEEMLKKRLEEVTEKEEGETNNADGEANVQKKRKRDDGTSNEDEDIGAL